MSIPTREEVEEAVHLARSGYVDFRDRGTWAILDADAVLRAEVEHLREAARREDRCYAVFVDSDPMLRLQSENERLRAALVAAAEDLERDADKLLEPTGLDYEHQAPEVQEAIDALDERVRVLRAAAEGQS